MTNTLTLAALIGMSILGSAVARDPSTLTLTGPSVVIFHSTPAEIDKMRADEDPEQLKAARADFEAGTTRLTRALRAYPQIKVLSSSADVVHFSSPGTPPVWRYSVEGGRGYLFYRPGQPVRVFAGVRSGDGLVCEAVRTFDLKPLPPRCDALPIR